MKVLAGDYGKNKTATLEKWPTGKARCITIVRGLKGWKKLKSRHIKSVEVVTDANKTSLIGKAGWGAAGSILLGPAGLLAGLVAGGNKHNAVVQVICKNGKKFLMECKQSEVPGLLALGY